MPSLLVYVVGDRMGDAMLKIPAVGALREALPEYHFTWLAGRRRSVFKTSLQPLVAGLIDEVIDQANIGVSVFEMFGRPLSHRHFDIVIDTQQSLRTTLILRRISHDTFISAAASGLFSDRKLRGNPRTSIQQRILALFSLAAGVDLVPAKVIHVPDPIDQRARQLVPDGRTYIGLCPGAGGQRKRWPLERFTELADIQLKAGRVPVFFLGPQEYLLYQPLRARVPDALYPEMMQEATNPLLTIALARRMRVCVTNDSGAGHLLAAGGRPVLSLYGHTNPEKFTDPNTLRFAICAERYGSRDVAAIPFGAVQDAVERLLRGEALAFRRT